MQEEVDINIPKNKCEMTRLRESREDIQSKGPTINKPATAYMQSTGISPHVSASTGLGTDESQGRGRKII